MSFIETEASIRYEVIDGQRSTNCYTYNVRVTLTNTETR